KHTIEVVVDRLVIRRHQAIQPESDGQLSPLRFPAPADNTYQQTSLKRVAERPALYDINAEKKSREASDGIGAQAEPRQENLDSAFRQRLTDSLETTLKLGNGVVLVSVID